MLSRPNVNVHFITRGDSKSAGGEPKPASEPVPKATKAELTEIKSFKKIIHGDKPFKVLLVGKSGSGKTTLLKKLVKEVGNKFAYVVLFGANAQEETWIDGKFRRTGYTEESLDKLWDLHKKRKMPALWIFDDISHETFSSKWWTGFITTCRHQQISVVFSVQNFKGTIPPSLRSNVNWCICTYSDNNNLDGLATIVSKTDKGALKEWCSKIDLGKYLLIHREAHTKQELQWLRVAYAE